MTERPTKPLCTNCDSPYHYKTFCPILPRTAIVVRKPLPRQTKPIPKQGKESKKWLATRAAWIKANPPGTTGYWLCYLQISPLCPKFLDKQQLTLDHVIGKGRDHTKAHDFDNLEPACGPCNSLKGSQSLAKVREKYGKALIITGFQG